MNALWHLLSASTLPTINLGLKEDRLLNEAVRSPFVQDTLVPLLGGEPPAFGIGGRKGRIKGEYYHATKDKRDSIHVFAPLRGQETPDHVLATFAHEFGHAVEFRKKHPELVKLVAKRWPEMQKRAVEFEYGATNPAEHFAEAYMNAVGILRQPRKDGQTVEDFRKEVEFWDKRVPGTREVVEYLRYDPFWRNHWTLMPNAPATVLPPVKANPPKRK